MMARTTRLRKSSLGYVDTYRARRAEGRFAQLFGPIPLQGWERTEDISGAPAAERRKVAKRLR